MGKSLSKNLAVIAYTTLSTDSRVLKECYAALEAGFTVDVYTLEHPENKIFSDFNIISSGRKQYKGNNKKYFINAYLRFFLFCLISLTRNYFKRKYSVIHFNNMPNFLVFSSIVPKIFGAKIILDLHDLMPEIFSAKFGMDKNSNLIKALYLEERLSAKFATEIISTNRFHTKRFRENGIKNKRITEIVNVADHKVYYSSNGKQFDDDKLIIAYPSTIAKRLGIDILIDAMEIIRSKNIKMELKIYGDGEYKSELHKIIDEKRLNNNVWLSDSFVSMKDLSREMDEAHIGVIPLPYDPSNDIAMPVKVYEYFAKKLCVVASDLTLLKDYFDDKILFFKAGDAVDLSEKLIRLYNDRDALKKIAEKGYAHYSERNWDYYKKKYQERLEARS